MKKILSIVGLSLALLAIAVPSVFAAEFIAPDKDSGNVTLSNSETHKNVYIAGGTIFINSNITGDLYGAGGTVTVEGTVEQDAVLAGGTITLNGQVGGDVRVAGGNITINTPIGGDILIAGGTVHLTEKASVAGDLVVTGGELTIDAPVTGAVKIDGGTVRINSSLAGKVSVLASRSFTVGSKAVIPSAITYKGVTEPVVQDGAQISKIDYQKIETHRGGRAGRMLAGLFTIVFVLKVVALILAGILLMKLFPRTSREAVLSMQRGMWTNLGIGFLALIVGPIAFFILLVIFLGFYIAMLLLFTWLIMLLVAILVASMFVGGWIIKVLTKKGEMRYDWQSLVIGVVVIGILFIVPIIGGLISIILLLMAFGGIIRQFHSRIKSEQHGGGGQVLSDYQSNNSSTLIS